MRTLLKIIGGIILVVGLVFYWLISQLTNAFSPAHNKVELVSNNGEKLYIKTENWGVTGDSQLTIITTEDDNEFKVDSTNQIVFKELEPFMYKVSNDTLKLILYKKATIPKGFTSNWIIQQTEGDFGMRKVMNGYKRI